MNHGKFSGWMRFFCMVCCFLVTVTLSACDDDDEGTIQIVNEDNHDYVVVLFQSYDDEWIDSLTVDEWPRLDSVDYFEDVDEGTYYLTITRQGENVIRAWSRTFELDEGEEECFVITNDGEIEDC